MNKKIMVIGCGFVGLSNALLLSERNTVFAIDKDEIKLDILKKKKIPFKDNLMEEFILKDNLNISFHKNIESDFIDSDFTIISTPTDYNSETNEFDTKSIEKVLSDLNHKRYQGVIVIKSTIPIGYTKKISAKFKDLEILFSPEFLRETTALEDNLYPDRIIVGAERNQVDCQKTFALLLNDSALNTPEILFTSTEEAEAIKLFANTYLAMRVSFFNELDSFAMNKGLNTKNIIEGVCKDKRIGEHYNNPSFGYGGYCLPKDTKQLLFNYQGIPNELISAVVKSNKTRKNNIVENIVSKTNKNSIIGIYRLVMKEGSDNFRSSSVFGIINRLEKLGYTIKVFEPNISSPRFMGYSLTNNLEEFKKESDLILCNRLTEKLDEVSEKVYTRDIFNEDK